MNSDKPLEPIISDMGYMGEVPFRWLRNPRELFPIVDEWFARDALYESKGLEDFGYKFLCEWFIHNGPDNWWILIDEAEKQLSPERFREWVKEAWEYFDNEMRGRGKRPVLSPESVAVLRILVRAPATMTATDLESMLMPGIDKPNYRLSRKTIGQVLRSLREAGYVDYPNGPRKGASITPRGRAYLYRNSIEPETH